MSATGPPDLARLLHAIEGLINNVENIFQNTTALSADDPSFERQRAQNRSLMAFKLLKARDFLEELTVAEAKSSKSLILTTASHVVASYSHKSLTLTAASRLVSAYAQTGFPNEALKVYETYLTASKGLSWFDSARLRWLQFELIRSCLGPFGDYEKAQAIFTSMLPPDYGDEASLIFTELYFSLIVFAPPPVRPHQPDLELFKAFRTLISQRYRYLSKNRPTITVVEPKLASPIDEWKPFCEDKYYITRDLTVPARQTLDKKNLTITTLNNVRQLVDRHFNGERPLRTREINVIQAETLTLAALKSCAPRDEFDFTVPRLEYLSQSLDFLPRDPPNLARKAALLVASISALNPLDRPFALAKTWLDKIMKLKQTPTLAAYQAQALLAMIYLHQDDPSLTDAFLATLNNLPTSPMVSETRLRALGALAAIRQSYGHLDQAYELRRKAMTFTEPVENEKILTDVLLGFLTGPLAPGQEEEAIEILEFLFQKSKIFDYEKLQAAKAVLSRVALSGRADLGTRIFQALKTIKLSVFIEKNLSQSVGFILESLAETNRYDQLELYVKALDSFNWQSNYFVGVKVDGEILLVKRYLDQGETAKALDLAAKIDALEVAGREMSRRKGYLRLVFINYYGRLGDFNQANAEFAFFKDLTPKNLAMQRYKSIGQNRLIAIAGALGLFEIALDKFLDKFQESLNLDLQEADLSLKTLFKNMSTSYAAIFILVLGLLHNRAFLILKAREISLSKDFLKKYPRPGRLAVLALGSYLVQTRDLAELKKLTELISDTPNFSLASEAKAEIQLLELKKLLELGRLAEAYPILGALAELFNSERGALIYANGLLAALEASAKAGLFFREFKLGKSDKPRRGQPTLPPPPLTKEAYQEENFKAEIWLDRLLALPDIENCPALDFCKRRGLRLMVTALALSGRLSEAERLFSRWPTPRQGFWSDYQDFKLYLNAAFSLIEAYVDANLVESAWNIAKKIMKIVFRDYLHKYYLRELGVLSLALQKNSLENENRRLWAFLALSRNSFASQFLTPIFGLDKT